MKIYSWCQLCRDPCYSGLTPLVNPFKLIQELFVDGDCLNHNCTENSTCSNLVTVSQQPLQLNMSGAHLGALELALVYIETGACLPIFYKLINISCSEHEVITLSRPCRLMSLYLSRFQLLLSLHLPEQILNK